MSNVALNSLSGEKSFNSLLVVQSETVPSSAASRDLKYSRTAPLAPLEAPLEWQVRPSQPLARLQTIVSAKTPQISMKESTLWNVGTILRRVRALAATPRERRRLLQLSRERKIRRLRAMQETLHNRDG